jgi:RNA polymerase sigma factor for flagellar operon FliA
MQLEEKRRALLKAIQDLDEHEKLVITLYYFEGLYLKEIGDILGVTESRVSQIHSRALGHLKELMSEFV